MSVPPVRCLLLLLSDKERQLPATPERLLCYTCLDCERYVFVTNTLSAEKFCLKTLNKKMERDVLHSHLLLHHLVLLSSSVILNEQM